MIQAFQVEHPGTPLRSICRWAGVSRSWFYEQPTTRAPDEQDVALRDAIEKIVLELPGYGYRRVTHELRRQDFTVNHKHVLRITREEALLCRLTKRFVVTTDSTHAHRVWPNLLKQMRITGLNQVWVADLTYIRLPGGFCFLAAILDAFSRRVVGWHLSRDIDTRLCLVALERALTNRCAPIGLVHHSDRGVQYASREYVARLERAGLCPSMSRRGNPYDNAKAESFFKTLKAEEVYLKDYQNFEEARANLEPFIESVYNRRRLHSRLGYQSPVAFEASLETSTAGTSTA